MKLLSDPLPPPGKASAVPVDLPLVDAIQREADYLRGKVDAMYEILTLLKKAPQNAERPASASPEK